MEQVKRWRITDRKSGDRRPSELRELFRAGCVLGESLPTRRLEGKQADLLMKFKLGGQDHTLAP